MCLSDENPLATLRSPDGRNEIRVWADPLSYAVVRGGVTLVSRTAIALQLDSRRLGGAVVPREVREEVLSGSLETPIYKKSRLSLAAHSLLLDCGAWAVRFIARDDGVAYRFETHFGGRVCVTGEEAAVTIPCANAACALNYGERFGCEETVPRLCAAGAIATDLPRQAYIYLPFVYSIDGRTVAVTESDVCDYPVWNLRRVEASEGVALASVFAGWPKREHRAAGWDRSSVVSSGGRWIVVDEQADHLVETAGTRTFPWRVFVLADAACRLCEADIVMALARPSSGDFSWVKPGKVAWDWWNAWDNQGEAKGCTTATYQRFIRFAAAHGIEYVILDEGWSETLNIWAPNPAVDVPGLIRFGAACGVGIILWMAWAQVAGDEARVAKHFASMGARGFKVDFMDRGDAACERFLWAFAEQCAKQRMLLDYHGAHRPTGLSRTFPNVLNYEGVHGLENMKFYRDEDFMLNDVLAAYLRMTAGPLDYTPGAMDNHPIGVLGGDELNPGSFGTRCRQLALMSLYEAPLQMLCDSPSKYERNRECLDFMAAVPVVWDETRALDGRLGEYIALARRKGEVWYVAAITDRESREIAFEATFLGAGEWMVEVFRDAPESDEFPTRYIHERQSGIVAGRRFAFRLAPGGAFTMRFTR